MLSNHRVAASAASRPSDPALDVRDLHKAFRRRVRRDGRTVRSTVVALDRVSLQVSRGETVAILGQNGSGKSTLIRTLATLLLPDGGRADVFGHDVVSDAAAVRRLVNRVSVEASFFKRMSAIENLRYSARFHGVTGRRARGAIPEILARVGFPPDRGTEPMENLSRGMQQKVALARALLTAPVLLLLDEPTTGLDPRSKREVQAFIRDLREAHDTTTLLCTHDLDEAQVLADRVGILDRGQLPVCEPVAVLCARYGAASLEEAFFTATGQTLADDPDDDREVYA